MIAAPRVLPDCIASGGSHGRAFRRQSAIAAAFGRSGHKKTGSHAQAAQGDGTGNVAVLWFRQLADG
jgi:hypothetical protein